MAVDYTTTGLLASLKRRGMIPSNDETLATADFLSFGTEELQTYCMSLLVGIREEYGVAEIDITMASGTAEYEIPERAIGDKIRNVLVLNGTTYVPLQRFEPEHVSSATQSDRPAGYIFRDNSIVLIPTPSGSGTLRVQYFRRPNALVATSAAATISSINVARTVITTTGTIPTTVTSGILVDVVDASPGFRTLAMDYTTTATTSGTTITLTTALPSSVGAGDYVCLAGESPVPQIPVELHPLLSQRIVVKALEAIGDPKVQVAEATCERMAKTVLKLLTPRSEGSARYLINRNGPGFTRYGRRGR